MFFQFQKEVESIIIKQKNMDEELKKLKCELCDRECFMLIQIEVASDSWGGGKGICGRCFKNGDIEEKVFLKNKQFYEERSSKKSA